MKLFKRLTAAALAVSMTFSAAAFQAVTAFGASTPTTYGGWYETAYATWPETSSNWTSTNSDTGLASSSATVQYKLSSESTYTDVDSALIRLIDDSTGRVDIPGLAAGTYDILITASTGTEYSAQVTVMVEDRSGYAHFNRPTTSSSSDNSYNGVGAYTDDGTPMTDADIIYITEENKNTVTYGSYTGLGEIASNIRKISNPLIIRFIGEIDTTTWSLSGTTITESSDATPIDGLLNRFYVSSSSDYTFVSSSNNYETASGSDTYIGMMDFKAQSSSGYTGFSNVTLEGIGTDAEFVNWGVSFRYCNSIEVKNITFTSYQEDGCSAQDSTRIWFHRCTFNKGNCDCDLTSEQDKGDGDGSSDLNACKNATISYCVYNSAHKTSLSGNGDSTQQWNYTYHHNYYNDCSQRLPLARYVNVHSYNNYTYSADVAISARASAFVFSEANYYDSVTTVFASASNGYGYGLIKSYDDTFSSTTPSWSSYIVQASSRTSEIENISKIDSTNQHLSTDTYINNFDVDSANFYYSNGASNVTYLTSAEDAKAYVTTYSGVMKDSVTYSALEVTDGYTTIEDDIELTPSNYTDSSVTPYFQGLSSIDTENTTSTYLRFTSTTKVSFKTAAGATIKIKAKNASTASASTGGTVNTRTLTLSGNNIDDVTYSYTSGTNQEITYVTNTFVSNSSAEDIYTVTVSANMNISSIAITFGDSEETTETTTEAGVIYDKAQLTFSVAETISEATTMCDYFSITPSMEVDANSKTVNGTEYSYRLKSGGASATDSSGCPTSRAITFTTAGSGIIQFCAAPSSESSLSSRTILIYNTSDYSKAVKTISFTSGDAVMTEICNLSSAGTYCIAFGGGVNIYSMTVAVGRSVAAGSDGNGYIFTDSSDSYAVVGVTSDNASTYSKLTVTAVGADDTTKTGTAETGTVYTYATVDDDYFVIKPTFLGSYDYLYVVKIEGSGGATDFTYSGSLT